MNVEARERFLADYLRIRRAEGRGSDDPAYYLALPFRDVSGKLDAQWRMRGRTYHFFERNILAPLEREKPASTTHAAQENTAHASRTQLDILDLGAGTGWLSYRLALRAHSPVAVDILTDSRDGLGAARHYFDALDHAFPTIDAEFDDLPFADRSFDLAIYNASLHYSADYAKTLREARRCLRPNGRIVVLDSPVYKLREHGEMMRRERREQFLKQYGTESDHVRSIEYLDLAAIDSLAREVGIEWRIHKPWYGVAWLARPLRAALKGSRPPSRFWILEGNLI